ncbi:MAG: cell division FtsA domain-containing protein [Leadbetterella sp.]
MENQNYIVGLEIATSKICAAGASYDSEGQIIIKKFIEKTITPEDEILRGGHLDDVQKTAEIVDQILEEMANDLSINLQDINVNISNIDIATEKHGGTMTRNGDSRQIQQKDVDKLVEDIRVSFKNKRDRTILHHLPLDFYVNEMRQNEKIVGKIGVQISGEFFFLTSPSDDLENLYFTIQGIRAKTEEPANNSLKIDNLLVSSVADSFTLLDTTIDDKRNGVAIVNVGAELTEIAVFKNGLRFLKVIPMAGNVITKDLCESFGLRFDEGEKLKKICGILPSDVIPENEAVVIERGSTLAPIEILLKNAVLICEWRIKEIAAVVRAELVRGGYDSNQLINGLILTGGTSNYGSAKRIFSEVTRIKNIREPRFNTNIQFEEFEFLKKAQYTTLMGLLLAQNNSFDPRVGNSILKHSPINVPEVKLPDITPVSKPKEKEKKEGFFGKIKKLIGDDSMDDSYN